jgi:hypothetical protein
MRIIPVPQPPLFESQVTMELELGLIGSASTAVFQGFAAVKRARLGLTDASALPLDEASLDEGLPDDPAPLLDEALPVEVAPELDEEPLLVPCPPGSAP